MLEQIEQIEPEHKQQIPPQEIRDVSVDRIIQRINFLDKHKWEMLQFSLKSKGLEDMDLSLLINTLDEPERLIISKELDVLINKNSLELEKKEAVDRVTTMLSPRKQ